MRIIFDPKTKAYINLDWMTSARYYPKGSSPPGVLEKVKSHGMPDRSTMVLCFHPASEIGAVTVYAETANLLNGQMERALAKGTINTTLDHGEFEAATSEGS